MRQTAPLQAAHTIMLGCIRATIWRHPDYLAGQCFVTLCRIQLVDGKPMELTHFWPSDLPVITHVIEKAYLWVVQKQASETPIEMKQGEKDEDRKSQAPGR